MEKLNFMREGMIKLPPGFRFQPTDEELVFEYLKRKVLSWPLPASIIPEINVCKFDPWDLPGDMEQERYFFSNKEAKYPNGNRINRATASGYWKATGVDRQIGSSSSRNNIIGMKKTLVFYRGKTPNASRTDWIMHEYRLVSLGTTASNFPLTNNSVQNSFNQLEKWVLCRIFLKKRNSEIIEDCRNGRINNAEPRFYDFMTRDNASFDSVSSSSNCSSITDEASSSGEDFDGETSSSHNFF
ncbi:hypothetical protein JCGZ_26399 [Jatropha curcas]|uniref:NAC transcription factor 010 n=1 Tax=Jatropha curcas TaxID=180498 RepID=R4NEP6_JATCU|nr:NAC domain-containing protein 83 [Jatropha curcas]AGL39666.1 NAC transcription factor 010 [Jatropha curcas]KDP22568.1 hypothetical protein JCGZ_26399 [Jatropha curcas]